MAERPRGGRVSRRHATDGLYLHRQGPDPGLQARPGHRLKREDVDAFLESQRVAPGSLSHLYPPYTDDRAQDDDGSGLSLSALTVSVAQAGQMLGISRAKAFRRAKSGELVPGVPVLLLGPRMTRVSKWQLEEYLAREKTEPT